MADHMGRFVFTFMILIITLLCDALSISVYKESFMHNGHHTFIVLYNNNRNEYYKRVSLISIDKSVDLGIKFHLDTSH